MKHLPPLPWSYSTNAPVGQHEGKGIVYLLDANGRKIGTVWGNPDEKLATAQMIMDASNALAKEGAAPLKPATESNMRDIKAALAAKFADAAGRDAELSCVCEMLEVDEDAARNLIAQGRRLLRLKREDAA